MRRLMDLIGTGALGGIVFAASCVFGQGFPPCTYQRCVVGDAVYGSTPLQYTCTWYFDGETGMKVYNGEGGGETYIFVCNQTDPILRKRCPLACCAPECNNLPSRAMQVGSCAYGGTEMTPRFCWHNANKPSAEDQPYPCGAGGGT